MSAIFAQRIEKVKLARYRNSAPINSAFRGYPTLLSPGAIFCLVQ
jgi:hypothetical protein